MVTAFVRCFVVMDVSAERSPNSDVSFRSVFT